MRALIPSTLFPSTLFRRRRGFVLLASWASAGLLGLLLLVTMPCGCSCRPPAAPESWDAGLSVPTAATAATAPAAEAPPGDAGVAGTGSGNSTEAGEAGTGANGETGDGRGGEGGEGASQGRPEGSGSDNRGNGGSGDGSGEGGGRAAGKPPRGATTPPGIGDRVGPGRGEEPEPAAGLFPGRRSSEPAIDATRAIAVAEAALAAAERDRNRGRHAEAYGKAADAYEAVQPHASDDQCVALAARAMEMLRDLAKVIDTKQTKARIPGPTIFE
jgi:hypothetical protein